MALPMGVVRRLWGRVVLPFDSDDPTERQRLRQVAVAVVFAVVSCLVYGAVFSAWGAPILTAIHLSAAGALALTPLVLRVGRSLRAGVQYALAVGTLLLTSALHFSGGFERAGMAWGYVPTVFAGILAGPRTIVVYATLTTGFMLFEWFRPVSALAPVRTLPPALLDLLIPLDVVGVSGLFALGVMALAVTRARAERETRDTLDELRSEVEERRRAEVAAHAAARAKTDFLAVMSHELRTPMNGVLGMAELLADGDLDDEQREGLGVIRGCASSLLVVVNDILDFSKLEAGKVELDPRPVCAARLAREVVELVRSTRQTAEPSFEVSGLDELWVAADDARLRQVLLNLVGNAAKFTERGVVELSVARGEGGVRFAVHDTGIGIPADRMQALFSPFEQAEASTARRFGGTGLGLSIARQLVRAMGGDIEVASTVGVGSTFAFTVPLPELGPQASAHEAEDSGDLVVDGVVLVVDDNAVNRTVARKSLERMGLPVETAASGEEALARAARGGLAAILMDVQMPGMDGLTATRLIREGDGDGARVPIIGLSANVLDVHRAEGRAAGMDDYLGKPFDRRHLRRILRQLARRA